MGETERARALDQFNCLLLCQEVNRKAVMWDSSTYTLGCKQERLVVLQRRAQGELRLERVGHRVMLLLVCLETQFLVSI